MSNDQCMTSEKPTVIHKQIDPYVEKVLGLTHEELVLVMAIAGALACQELDAARGVTADRFTQNEIRRLERLAGSSFSFHGADYRITTDDAGNKRLLVRLDSESE